MDTSTLLAALRTRNAANKPRLIPAEKLTPIFGEQATDIYIRKANMADIDARIRYEKKFGESEDYYPSAFSLCRRLCDANGVQQFDSDNLDLLRELGKLDYDDIDKVSSMDEAEEPPGN